jgi:hypothetical protein
LLFNHRFIKPPSGGDHHSQAVSSDYHRRANMEANRKHHFLNQFTKLAYSSGVMFLIAGLLLSLVSQPASASTAQKGNPTGTSLVFTGGCDGDCEVVTATVCNTGTEDMTEPVMWELYYSPKSANQRDLVMDVGGEIQLDGKKCTTLTAAPNKGSGQYWFKAYQPEGHPGTGVLFSEGCQINSCSTPVELTAEPTSIPTSVPTVEPTSQPTILPTEKPSVKPKVEFTDQNTGICQYEPGDISATIVVTLPEGMTARLQAEYHVVHPVRTAHYYIDAGIVQNGDTFTYSGLWPGIQPGDKVVEIHFGAALLDVDTGNPLGAFASLDYFWYPYICSPPTPTPTVMLPLQFSYDCTGLGIEWKVINPNPFDVDLNWELLNGSKSGTETVPAESNVQVYATPASPQVILFSWEGPEGQIGSSTETNGDDYCEIEQPTPTVTPTEDPGDPSPSPTPQPTNKPGEPKKTQLPTPVPQHEQNNPSPTGDVELPENAANVLLPAQIVPLDPPVAVASAQDSKVLIPVTGADFAGSAAGDLNNLLIYLGLVFIGVALMTQGVFKKFIGE